LQEAAGVNRFQRVNIHRVAEESGVSIKTVSRVINDLPDVAPETRQRVQSVIERLGYRPNAIARSLVSRKTHTLGLINADFTDPNISLLITGARDEALKHGYLILLGSTEIDPSNQPEYVHVLANRLVEGLIYVRPNPRPIDDYISDVSNLNEMLNAGMPVVALTSLPFTHPQLIQVDADNLLGGRIAARYLLELGHRRLAMITGPLTASSVIDQTEGYRLALEEAGLPFDPAQVVTGDWSFAGGVRGMQALLERGVAFTALVAQNDRMALGAMSILAQVGRRVPEDVSVIGYDGEDWTAYCRPALTTVLQPFVEMGARAARLLIQAIESAAQGWPQDVRLSPALLERDSCARCPD
jgi:LacI family transcriptional regulator